VSLSESPGEVTLHEAWEEVRYGCSICATGKGETRRGEKSGTKRTLWRSVRSPSVWPAGATYSSLTVSLAAYFWTSRSWAKNFFLALPIALVHGLGAADETCVKRWKWAAKGAYQNCSRGLDILVLMPVYGFIGRRGNKRWVTASWRRGQLI